MKAKTAVCLLAVLLASVFNSPLGQNKRELIPSAAAEGTEQFETEINIAKYGADCTGRRDASGVLIALTSAQDKSSNKIISTRGCSHLRLDHQWLIFGQENLTLDLAATVISGCNGARGAVVLVNRSGNLTMQGGVIEAKGGGCSSDFTGSIETRNSGRGGYTSTHNTFRSMFLTSNLGGTPITNYVGFYVNGTPNQELYHLDNVSIHCQGSTGSKGFWSADGNADSTTLDGKSRVNSCYRNIQMDGGSLTAKDSNLSTGGGFNRYGSGGAVIYENGGCVNTLVDNVIAEGSGQFINHTHVAGDSCSHYIQGNQISFQDIDPAVYPIEAPGGTQILANNDFGNGGVPVTVHKNTLIGSDVNGISGPQGQVVDLGGNNLNDPGNPSAFQLTNQAWQNGANLLQTIIGPAVSSQTGSTYGGRAHRLSTGLIIPGLGLNSTAFPNNTPAWPGSGDHLLLGDGVVEITGLAVAYMVALKTTIIGTPGSQQLRLSVFGKDASGNRTTKSAEAVLRNAPNRLSVSSYVSLSAMYAVPGAKSYDVVHRCDNGSFALLGTGVSLPFKIQANPPCPGSYALPNYNETAGMLLRVPLGITTYGNVEFNTDNANDIGASAAHRPRSGYFGTSVVTPRLAGITDTAELAHLNSGLWHGKSAIDFSGRLNFGLLAQGSCTERTISVPGAVIRDAIAPAWPPTLESGLFGMMIVSASDTVKVRLCNLSDSRVDPATQVFGGRVMK